MLGVVHRTVLGKGAPHFANWFFRSRRQQHGYDTRAQTQAHGYQLHDYLDGSHTELLRRSALGLPRVYNSLPVKLVECKTVKAFQKGLQKLALEKLDAGAETWETFLSARATKIEA